MYRPQACDFKLGLTGDDTRVEDLHLPGWTAVLGPSMGSRLTEGDCSQRDGYGELDASRFGGAAEKRDGPTPYLSAIAQRAGAEEVGGVGVRLRAKALPLVQSHSAAGEYLHAQCSRIPARSSPTRVCQPAGDRFAAQNPVSASGRFHLLESTPA